MDQINNSDFNATKSRNEIIVKLSEAEKMDVARRVQERQRTNLQIADDEKRNL